MTRTLEQMQETAQRQLDGMRANPDVLAKDVLQLIRSIRFAQSRARSTGFASAFDKLFEDFKGFSKGGQ